MDRGKSLKRLKQKRTNRLIIITAIALVALIAVMVVWSSRGKKVTELKTSSSPSVTKGNSTHGEPSPTPESTRTPTPAPSGGKATLAKPSLQKSSGNAPGSSIPAGAVVEFSCESAGGLGCEIILTDRNNTSRLITLPSKTITGNGRGQYFAIFDWTAVLGSWKVVAKASDQSGNFAISDSQILEVK